MISSLSIFFLLACFLYFKQYYETLIDVKFDDVAIQKTWKKKLMRKLMVLLVGVGVIAVLYAVSFTLMRLYPDMDNVKLSRRIVDLVATAVCIGLFFLDKRELDKELVVKDEGPMIEIPDFKNLHDKEND